MRNLKHFLFIIIAFMVTLVTTANIAFAEEGDVLPAKFRYYYSQGSSYEQTVKVTLANINYRIDNVTTSSKYLTAGITRYEIREDTYENTQSNTYEIGLIAEKEGTYTVKYQVVDLDGNLISTHSMKVYAYYSPVTVLTLGGKGWGILSGTSGKVHVETDEKNPIKKIEKGVYKVIDNSDEWSTRKESEMIYKEVKNDAVLKYGTCPYQYSYEYVSQNYYGMNYNSYGYKWLRGETEIRVTYKDQYTKRNETVSQTFYKILK